MLRRLVPLPPLLVTPRLPVGVEGGALLRIGILSAHLFARCSSLAFAADALAFRVDTQVLPRQGVPVLAVRLGGVRRCWADAAQHVRAVRYRLHVFRVRTELHAAEMVERVAVGYRADFAQITPAMRLVGHATARDNPVALAFRLSLPDMAGSR